MRSYNFIGGHTFETSLWIVVLILFLILVTGCVSKPGNVVKNENITVPKSTVPPAPMQLYIKVGQLEQFTYFGHNITVNYSSANPIQIVTVTFDGAERIFQKEPTENPAGIYWKKGNLSFTIKPVVWEIRDAQNIPIYENTWNTSEIYFEVQVTHSSEVTERSKL